MQQITQMGYPSLIVPIIVIAIFGIDFKKSFLLFQLFMWTDMVTDILKILVGFPRPYYVDKKVINLENNITSTSNFSGNGIKGIFALPDNQILNTFHLQEAYKSGSLGFPSGHVSLTTALWGGSATVFDNRLIKILTPFAMVLMAFSRVYLGKHFIGDVVGGAIVGLISIVVFAYFLKSSLKQDFFKKESFELAFRSENLFFYCFMFVIPAILVAFSLIGSHPLNTDTGYLLGMNVAYLLIIRKGIPDDTGTVEQRATRVFIALLLFEVSKIILDCGFCTNYLFAIEFLKTFIPAATIWVSVVICKKFNLYRRNEESL
jgi:membrane-associated phospholipid phosphatase